MSALGMDDDGGGGSGGDESIQCAGSSCSTNSDCTTDIGETCVDQMCCEENPSEAGGGSAQVSTEMAQLMLAMFTITATLITRCTSAIWGIQMHIGKCGEAPEKDGDNG